MPRWGLTTEMREIGPWGLDPAWLAPAKVILDPVHGDVHTTVLEQALIDTAVFQRLRRIRQLHGCHLVYPGATHSRFSHALGALKLAQDLIDRVVDRRFDRHAVHDYFEELDPASAQTVGAGAVEQQSAVEVGLSPSVTAPGSIRRKYLTVVAEATVLARLGALLHDLGHVPFSHTIENDLDLLEPHDSNTVRMAELWDCMVDEMRKRFLEIGLSHLASHMAPLEDEHGSLRCNLAPLIVSKAESVDAGKMEYRFVSDIVTDTICADLLDYLRRDHLYTGLPMTLGDRFMSAFYVTAEARRNNPKRMALLLHREGRVRQDVSDEVLKHLRYRYELTDRVYMHHAKLSGDVMLGRLVLHVKDALLVDPYAVPRPDRRAALAAVPRLSAARVEAGQHRDIALEDLLLSYGDDALLEVIANCSGKSDSVPLRAAARLARDLLDRRLYAHVGDATGSFGTDGAEEMWEEWGEAGSRRSVEARAARAAEIEDPDHLLLWIAPASSTRLKLAGVLVDHGRGISKFSDFSKAGREIYDAHEALWKISLYAHRSTSPEQRCAAAAYLAGELDVGWDRYEPQLGSVPSEWRARLAAMEALDVPKVNDEVQQLVDKILSSEVAARHRDAPTHRELVAYMRALLDRLREQRDGAGQGPQDTGAIGPSPPSQSAGSADPGAGGTNPRPRPAPETPQPEEPAASDQDDAWQERASHPEPDTDDPEPNG